MATLQEKLADSLAVLKAWQDDHDAYQTFGGQWLSSKGHQRVVYPFLSWK
jgi:hypothetical protein